MLCIEKPRVGKEMIYFGDEYCILFTPISEDEFYWYALDEELEYFDFKGEPMLFPYEGRPNAVKVLTKTYCTVCPLYLSDRIPEPEKTLFKRVCGNLRKLVEKLFSWRVKRN